MAQVLDYSAGKPGAAAIKAAGYTGAVRYIGYPGRTKCTDFNELLDFNNNGLGVALVFENSANWWRRGYEGGRADAGTARSHANAIGFPKDRPIYYAIDQDVSPADYGLAVNYIRGAASVEGFDRTGGYGEFSVIEALYDNKACKYLWQCRAWSGTPIQYSGHRHLFQRVGYVYVGGIACDVNDVNQADWGQHNIKGDTMSDADAYAGVRNLFLNMAKGEDEEARKAFVGTVWTAALANPDDPANPSAEARLALTDGRVQELTAEMVEVKQTLAKVQTGGVDVDAVVDKLWTKYVQKIQG